MPARARYVVKRSVFALTLRTWIDLHAQLLLRTLTVKLRGCAEAPDGAEGAQFPSARGANQEALHGPLQRLLDVMKCLLARPTSGRQVKPNAKQDKENSKTRRKPRKVPLPQVTADKDGAAQAKDRGAKNRKRA